MKEKWVLTIFLYLKKSVPDYNIKTSCMSTLLVSRSTMPQYRLTKMMMQHASEDRITGQQANK